MSLGGDRGVGGSSKPSPVFPRACALLCPVSPAVSDAESLARSPQSAHLNLSVSLASRLARSPTCERRPGWRS